MAKKQKPVSLVNEKLTELTQHILTYESDTFSADQSKITKWEAMCLASDFVVFCISETVNNQENE